MIASHFSELRDTLPIPTLTRCQCLYEVRLPRIAFPQTPWSLDVSTPGRPRSPLPLQTLPRAHRTSASDVKSRQSTSQLPPPLGILDGYSFLFFFGGALSTHSFFFVGVKSCLSSSTFTGKMLLYTRVATPKVPKRRSRAGQSTSSHFASLTNPQVIVLVLLPPPLPCSMLRVHALTFGT